MQKGWVRLRVMVCSQNTCSGHCTTPDLRMRFSAYVRPVVSSAQGRGLSGAGGGRVVGHGFGWDAGEIVGWGRELWHGLVLQGLFSCTPEGLTSPC